MFNCEECGVTFGPKVKPVRAVDKTRDVSYHNEYYVEDEYGNRELRQVDSVGTEVVHEVWLCEADAEKLHGIPQTPTPKAVKPIYEFWEKDAEAMPLKLVAVAVHNALERVSPTDENGKPVERKLNKRAERDSEVAIQAIKSFSDGNPDFKF